MFFIFLTASEVVYADYEYNFAAIGAARAGQANMAMVIAFFISVINTIMPLIMRQFALYEKAEMSVSLSAKLSLLKFLNTSVIYVAVHQEPQSWFSSDDLVYDLFIVLMFAVSASAINFCILLSMICVNKCTVCFADEEMTQREANKLVEHPPFDVENSISDMMNLILSCLFYAPLVPLAMPLCMAGILVNYIVVKFQLACLNKMPDDFGPELTMYFADLIPYATIVLAIGYMMFSAMLYASTINLDEMR